MLVEAFNAVGGSNKLVILNVVPPAPVISSSGSTTALVGRDFSYPIIASENPTSYAATGLPTGVILDSSSGIISGQFPAPGVYTINLSATNDGGTGTKTLTVNVSNGSPYDTKLYPRGVHENQPVGTGVGYFSTLTPAPGDTFS